MTRIVATIGGAWPLSARAKRFAVLYAREGKPAYLRAIEAGYSAGCADHRASVLLNDPRVQQAIEAECQRLNEADRKREEREQKNADAAARAEALAEFTQRLHGLGITGQQAADAVARMGRRYDRIERNRQHA